MERLFFFFIRLSSFRQSCFGSVDWLRGVFYFVFFNLGGVCGLIVLLRLAGRLACWVTGWIYGIGEREGRSVGHGESGVRKGYHCDIRALLLILLFLLLGMRILLLRQIISITRLLFVPLHAGIG